MAKYYKDSAFPFLDRKYQHDITFVSSYGIGDNKKLKVTTLKTCRTDGIELDEPSNRCMVNDEKLENNIVRARSSIFELANCNEWEYYLTGTLDGSKYDREDLEKYHKDFTQFVRDMRKKYGNNIQYLVVPELHSDGKTWHMHGFVRDIPKTALRQFKIGDKMGKKLAEKVKNGEVIYDWLDYHDKFGFCDLEPIKNHEAVSKYVTKYINKNLASSVKELNAHMYYHSRGLKTAEKIKKGRMSNLHLDNQPLSSFSNDHCSVQWYPDTEENRKSILEQFEQ